MSKKIKPVEKSERSKRLNLLKTIMIGLVVFQVVVILISMFLSKGKCCASSNDNKSSFFPFWLIVFIPIIAARKKISKLSYQQKLNRFYLLIGLALLVLIIMIVFLQSAF
ncbi:hypothetical protein ACFLZ1_01980 [Patescibacteria group bacterium]